MYEFLSGDLVEIDDGTAVVVTGGVGYRLLIPASTTEAIRGRRSAKLYTVHRIRDEQSLLFGFATKAEREIFGKICSVSGVGPGIALAVLSAIPIEEFQRVVVQGDSGALQRVKGVGKKTAQRLVLELREVVSSGALALGGPGTADPVHPLLADLVGALVNLGFSEIEAQETVRAVREECEPGAEFDELFRAAMRRGRKGR